MGSVFISYRREDSQGQARALFQDLVTRLGRDAVFMDVDSIALGRDFRDVLQERLATCDLMLVLIGREWLVGTDSSGRRRLDNPGDFVRLEIAAALKRKIPTTPLLVQGAQMPTAEQLPADINDLAYRNGFELSHNRWESDVQELVKRLGLASADGGTLPLPAGSKRPAKSSLAAAGLVAAALAVAGATYLYRSKGPVNEGVEASRPEVATASKAAPANDANRAKKPGDTHYFDPALSQLRISTADSYVTSPFTVENLDLDKDFRIDFQIKSTRQGGSTRYGIAWNFTPEDFMLFTLHSGSGGAFSVGHGKGRTQPWVRFAEGAIADQFGKRLRYPSDDEERQHPRLRGQRQGGLEDDRPTIDLFSFRVLGGGFFGGNDTVLHAAAMRAMLAGDGTSGGTLPLGLMGIETYSIAGSR
jgi:hypothetical protein